MRDIYRNPLFYSVLVPIITALWPALIWGVYLPSARAKLTDDHEQYNKAMPIIDELITTDPERLNSSDATKGAPVEFDYATAVQKTAEFCSVPALSCTLSSGTIVTSKGQKSQSANVELKDVDIAKFARFLSVIQLRWSSLQCTKVTLRKKKGAPDAWDVVLTFKYFY